jgi:molybdopterin synthase catalytic subunit
MATIVKAEVTTDVLDADHFRKLVSDPSAGAVVIFSGDVRNHDGGKGVASLTYEAHPDAQKVLAQVVDQVTRDSELVKVAVAHRYGPIAIGECAFLVCVSAAHRQAAFAGCQAIVDEVKTQIPIWKHQVFVDGTDEWVNFA